MKNNVCRLAVGITLTFASVSLGACSTIGAKPWDRDILARQSMQLDTHPLITGADMHIYFSKEASGGGRTSEGGGCGCN